MRFRCLSFKKIKPKCSEQNILKVNIGLMNIHRDYLDLFKYYSYSGGRCLQQI